MESVLRRCITESPRYLVMIISLSSTEFRVNLPSRVACGLSENLTAVTFRVLLAEVWKNVA